MRRAIFPMDCIGIDTCSVYEKLSKVLLLLWTMLLWLMLLIMMADRDDDYSKWNKMRISARKIALIITKGFDNNVNVPFSLPVTIRRSRYNHDNVWGPYIRFYSSDDWVTRFSVCLLLNILTDSLPWDSCEKRCDEYWPWFLSHGTFIW